MPESPRLDSIRTDTVTGLLAQIADVGRDHQRGGYSRPVFSAAERDLTGWFTEQASRRGLDVHTDLNGITWASMGELSAGDAVVTGSHLDSVPGGGAFDGPLGICSALVAIDRLHERGVVPRRPLAIAVFPEEEGSRFGVACLGSRLLTGAIDADRARSLRDEGGATFAEVATAGGLDPRFLGQDDGTLATIGTFLELHVEQGRGLIDLGRPVGIARSILGHGRWRITVSGQGNHAGSTLMADRRDPMLAAAQIVVAVREAALAHPDARATVGRLNPMPGGTNVIASTVDLWLDVRHPQDHITAAVVQRITGEAERLAAEEGCSVRVVEESLSGTVEFPTGLRDRLEGLLPDSPLLDTGAGHDAGVLGARVEAAMLFVRNPTGVSHSPEEHVEADDAEAGSIALADALEALLTRD
ncbi:allantoate amidohydrolase [Glaciihabitans sp. INWT7]|uniref:allantoate amidohydrolase n=1 Tax=Glaciihabitans sp. INWT7 TaxID=2596912 RepID=UPI00162941FB|nr:allantoate amidohydrolase [Glaciihabitans sp. INWT7]QNE47084.1 allantoate amidohydrolase [Glaciihabitans sp. INWT7]